jgi:phenylacetate-coenzyme A ligase PaaK-like adenylate-forming protein
MQEHGIELEKCLPTDFPVLTKRLLHDNYDDIVTDRRVTLAGITEFLQHSHDPEERYLGEFVVVHTSGSSGEVGHFVFSSTDWMRGIAGLARVNPPRFRRTRIAFFGATGGHFATVSWSVTARHGISRYFYDLATLDINAPLAETLSRLDTFQPHILGGYATGNKILAEAQLAGRLQIRPEVVQCGGEPLTAGDQAWLEQVFACPCINMYGASEAMLMGVARTGDPGMTLFDDELIVEPAADHILVTNLFNRTLPLIRYRISDTLRMTDAQSPYGHYPVIAPVVGRNEWMPVFRNSQGETDFISPHIINEIFVPGVWRFQMRWIDETTFRFAICLDTGLDATGRANAIESIKARLYEILDQKGLSNVQFDVDVVDDIPVDPVTRKFKLVLSQVNANTLPT